MYIGMDQVLRLLGQRSIVVEPDTSIHLQEGLVSQQTLDSYPKELRDIYFHLFSPDEKKINLSSVMPFVKQPTKMPICNKILHDYDFVYRCYDCSDHQGSVICTPCFEAGDHAGHRFRKIGSGGGNCDCGNPLALKAKGFCRNHTGETVIPDIDQAEIKRFEWLVGQLFEWAFTLRNINLKQFNKLCVIIFNYLKELNHESIIYNVMTDQLLRQPSGGQLLVDRIFTITDNLVSKSVCYLYFKMFSLDKFKYHLAVSFLKAYNSVAAFKESGFHCLFIQLFANDWLVVETCKKDQLVICPSKGDNSLHFLQDFSFMCSIKDEPSILFYSTYFHQRKLVPFQFLQTIENKLEEKPEMHLVDLVTTNMQYENYYYSMYGSVINKVKSDKPLLRLIIRGLIQEVSQHHSYRRNKVILPYHRIISMGLFALTDGYIDELSFEMLAQELEISQQRLQNFVEINFRRMLRCLFEFAVTFTKSSYLDNYLALYIKSGQTCINFDYLFINQMVVMLHKARRDSAPAIQDVLEQAIQRLSKQEPKGLIQELISSLINLVAILTETIVSPSQLLITAHALQINNPKLQSMRKDYLSGILKGLGSMTREELKKIENYFLGFVDDQILLENCEFDKVTKKYLPKEKNTPPICMAFYPSRLKISNTYSKKQFDRSLPKQQSGSQPQLMDCEKDSCRLLNTLIPVKFLRDIFQLIQANCAEVQRDQTVGSLREQVRKLILASHSEEYHTFLTQIEDIFSLGRKLSEQAEEEVEKLKKEDLKKRKQERLNKFKNKQNKFLEKFSDKMEEEPQIGTANVENCMICRSSDSKQEEVLCYLANFSESNLINAELGHPEETSLFFISCNHTAHYKCCQQAFENNSTFKCPLCKFPCNCMLPMPGYSNAQSASQMLLRIGLIRIHLKPKDFLQKQHIFVSVLKSFCEQIGIVGSIDPAFYEKKFKSLATIIFNMLSLVLTTLSEQQINEIKKQSQEFLEDERILEGRLKFFRTIQTFVYSYLFKALFKSKPSLQQVYDAYSQELNYFDLKYLIHNLFDVAQEEGEQLVYEQGDKVNEELPRVKEQFSLFRPPETVKDLIIARDSSDYPKCKNGHNICICCQCHEAYCLDCKHLDIHSRDKHANNSVFFSLLSGGLVCVVGNIKIMVPSLYENKIGNRWGPEKEPEGFTLENSTYEEYGRYLLLRCLGYYFQTCRPELMENRAGRLFNLNIG